MRPRLAEIEEQAQLLPPEEREELARRLLDGLEDQRLTDVDLAWLEVAEKRFEDYRSGKDPGIAAGAFFKEIEESQGWS